MTSSAPQVGRGWMWISLALLAFLLIAATWWRLNADGGGEEGQNVAAGAAGEPIPGAAAAVGATGNRSNLAIPVAIDT
ncbi:MAG: hypothetical protein ACREMD_11615, partial [Gemmatimonadota bacterium]